MEANQLFEQALDLLLAKDMDGFVDLFAPDCTFEFPFAEGTPERLNGREALREYLADYPQKLDIAGFPSVVVHRTTDPATIVAEFTARGRTVATGADYEMRYVAVIVVRDGAIASYRDYWSPVMGAKASGELADLVTALGGEVRS
ncbi:nuclear transport factor 2 family protein [Saccharopolyspora elongata]|uniref:Nuclear transport factor 2 family protein n=1 Tax=Saccharopolyspora elongata TaxID=2530387 RepID=A0A4R4YEK5_9PSEU|nr:nuclear transport factor 2 family protein [Saccharopolyspora elongata]TDD43191.1 nuclear transport factor 2 family protein [Saccharopolyspora elongata]